MLLTSGTRVTFALSCRGYGWTITLYLNTNSTGFAAETVKAKTLATLLTLATNAATTVDYIRLEDARALRTGIVFPFLGNNVTTFNGVQPSSCAYLRLYNNNFTQSKLIFFRGLSTDIVQDGGVLNQSSAQVPAIANFANQLSLDNWYWLGATLPAPSPVAVQSVTTAPQPVPAVNPLTSFPQIQLADGIFNAPFFPAFGAQRQPLSLSGLKGCDTLNGSWIVKPTSNDTCIFERQVLFNAWLPGTGQGYSRQETLIAFGQNFSYAPVFVIERFAERKPGRPLYLSRGKSNRRKVTY